MTNRYDDKDNDSTSIDASDGLIPQLVYGQTERAGQALGGFLSFLSMYLIRSSGKGTDGGIL